MMRLGYPSKQAGVALITALLITALVTVAAVAMATRQQLDIRRTGNMLGADQAYLYSLAAEQWARQILLEDGQKTQRDDLKEDWATVIPPIPVEGGSIQGEVKDLQARFNLNNLLDANGKPDPVQVRILQNLLNLVDASDNSLHLSPGLANVVLDWVDADVNTSPGGAEDVDYLNLTPPYRTGNRLLHSPSELRAMAGFSPEAVAALTPLVAALPESGTKVNVNTAPLLVLLSLDQNLTPQIVQAVMARREQTPFDSATDFVDMINNDYQITIDPKLVDVKSEYFAVKALANINRSRVELHSMLMRKNGKVRAIRRGIGVD